MTPVLTKHWQFLEDEMKAGIESFRELCEKKTANTLLFEKELLFVGQFVGIRGGEILVKFYDGMGIPRKRDYLQCLLLPKVLRNYKNWGTKTYKDLYQVAEGCECVAVWQRPSEEKNMVLVGFSDADVDFVDRIRDTPGLFLIFGPQIPPIEYLATLQKVVIKEENGAFRSGILSLEGPAAEWTPAIIEDEQPFGYVSELLDRENRVILQGPPGTGKTFLVAQLCKKYMNEGKSVLVMALTNRALMEVAEKEDLAEALKNGHVYKTSVTANEMNEIPTLHRITEIAPHKSRLVLATFFMASRYAAGDGFIEPFDVVIMDEASQGFTATFAASVAIGRKCLWVGDTHQMPPIVKMNPDIITELAYSGMKDGFDFLASHSGITVHQLSRTRRFGERAADFTGLFYNSTLRSLAPPADYSLPEPLSRLTSKQGGPSLILMDMEPDIERPENAINYTAYIFEKIRRLFPKKQLAVLTHMVKTARALDHRIRSVDTAPEKTVCETIARIQGLTVDICILLICNHSYMFSLEERLFNVATSRAREHTIIIADRNILGANMSPRVRKFLEHLDHNQRTYID